MKQGKFKLNYWVVIISGFAAFLSSLIWYSPLVFGEIWEQYRNPPNPDIPQWTMAFAPLREIVASYVFAILIVRLNLKHWKSTVRLMFLLRFMLLEWRALYFGTICNGNWGLSTLGTG